MRIVASIVGVILLALGLWFIYGGSSQRIDVRFMGRFLLGILCSALAVPFVDTGFFGTDVWIRLLESVCK